MEALGCPDFGGVRVTVDPTSSAPGGPGPRTYGPGAPCVTWRFWIGPPTTQEVGHESRRNCRAESDDREHCKRPFDWRSTVPAPATQRDPCAHRRDADAERR